MRRRILAFSATLHTVHPPPTPYVARAVTGVAYDGRGRGYLQYAGYEGTLSSRPAP
jgi:hypothetical protein